MDQINSDFGYLLVVVVLAFLATFVVACHRGRFDSRNYFGPIVVGLTLGTLCFGFVGNQREHIEPPASSLESPSQSGDAGSSAPICERCQTQDAIDSLYESFQLLSLNAAVEEGGDGWLSIARLLAVALIIVLATEVIRYWLADSLQRLWIMRWLKGHTVVFGLGQIGYSMTEDLLGDKDVSWPQALRNWFRPRLSRWLIVVESNPECPRLNHARELGAVIIQGDATDRLLLKRLGLERADSVFFATGGDEQNLEAVTIAEELLHAKEGRPAAPGDQSIQRTTGPHLHVHLSHPELRCVLDRFPKAEGFNLNRRIALDLLTQMLKYRPQNKGEVAHVVISGFGPTAEEVVRQLAECGHFESLRRLRMTIVFTPEEREAVRAFEERHPRLFPARAKPLGNPFQPKAQLDLWEKGTGAEGEVQFIVNGCFFEQAAGLESDFVHQNLAILAEQDGVLPIVVLCGEVEERNCSLGLALRHEIDQRCNELGTGDRWRPRKGFDPVPIFVLAPSKPNLSGEVANNDNRDEATGIKPFGQSKLLCSKNALSVNFQKHLAEVIARSYELREAPNASNSEWLVAELSRSQGKWFAGRPAWEQRSNLSAAVHAHVKLASLGLRLMAPDADDAGDAEWLSKPDPGTINRLAEIEHNRWMAERLLSGWTYGEGNNAQKKRIAMVPWSQLEKVEKSKDRDQVKRLLSLFNLLSLENQKVVGWQFRLGKIRD